VDIVGLGILLAFPSVSDVKMKSYFYFVDVLIL